MIVRIDESVEDEEWGAMKLQESLTFLQHSFGQYQIEVRVEILDQIKSRLIEILEVDIDDWTID